MGRRLRAAVLLAILCALALTTAQPAGAWTTPSPRAATGAASSASKPSAAKKRKRLKSLCAAKRTRRCQKIRASARQTLTVNLGGQGTGSVAGPGIICPGDCLEGYRSGTKVTLLATPTAGSRFTGWAGACNGTGSCKVTMNRARLVTAVASLNARALEAIRGD